MKHKLHTKKLLEAMKANSAEQKTALEAKAAKEKLQAEQLNEQNNVSKKQGVNMKLTKQAKHELALLKLWTQMKAKNENTIATQEDFTALVNELVEAKKYEGIECKAIEDTQTHPNLMREIQSSDMIFSFDPKSEAGELLSLFKRYDLPVSGKVTLPIDNEALELQHVTENGEPTNQNFTETLYTLETSRSAMTVTVSRSLQFKSIINLLAYIENRINAGVSRGMAEGIINGQDAADAARQDSGYDASKMGKKMAGIRVKLAANSYTLDADKKELDSTDGRALMQAMFDACGARFSRNQKAYVILAARPEKLKISALKQGAGVTGINQSAAAAVYDDTYQGVRVIETGFLKSRTAASGSGYGETGFVKSATTHNDHGSLLLIDPSQVWWHYGAETYDVEVVPKKDQYEITLNCQAGWNVVVDARNQPGVLVRNIGADIGSDA